MKDKYWILMVLAISFVFSFHGAAENYKENSICGLGVDMEKVVPEFLYKIASIQQWEDSLQADHLILLAADHDFIHLAKEDQVAGITKKYWNNTDYILLKLRVDALLGKLVLEANPGGVTKYYHLYEGTIPKQAIVEHILIRQK